jgi:putative redox protein
MGAKVTWKGKMAFDGEGSGGFHLPLDTAKEQGGEENGFRPMELLLVGRAGCTAMDVISILKKKRQDVTGFEVSVNGERASEHPKVYTHIVVNFTVAGNDIDPAAVERAVELSETKYCSAYNTLNKTAMIEHTITIQNSN